VAFILAQISPCGFNVGHCAVIDSFYIVGSEIVEHGSVQVLAMHLFGLHSVYYLLAHLLDAIHEFRTHIVERSVYQILKRFLIRHRAYKGHTVPVWKEAFKEFSDPVLVFYCVCEPFLGGQRFFQILFRTDRLAIIVHQLQSEVADHPDEVREIAGVLLRVDVFWRTLGANLDVFRQIYHQAHAV